MNLPEFEPAYWVVDVYKFPTKEKDMKRTSRELKMTVYFETEEEAFKCARGHTAEYEVMSFKGEVREATPRDHAQQRIYQIAAAIAKELDDTFQKEQDILAYDTWEYGKIDYKSDIMECVVEVLENYPPDVPFNDYP